MPTYQHESPVSKIGSIILEIALVIPVFLLLGVFMLTVISCARADIIFSQAVNQVTEELAVAVPIAGAGIDLAGKALEYIDSVSVSTGYTSQTGKTDSGTAGIITNTAGGIASLMEQLGVEGEDIFGTLLFGEGIRNRIVQTYYTYNSTELLLHRRIERVSVYLNYDEEQKIIWINVYYNWKTLFGTSERKIISAVPIFGDLIMTLPAADSEMAKSDEVWLLSNFERGHSLRTTCGGNLPTGYPVIAKWENGTVTSIKSIDLTAPGYQSYGSLSKNIIEFINDLAGFEGTDAPWGKDNVQISPDQICHRVLHVVIPENSTSEAYSELESCIAYASARGIDVNIEKYGNSYRFIDKASIFKSAEA